MARAWIEEIDVQSDDVAGRTVTTIVEYRRELSEPRPRPVALTAPPRSRGPYYFGLVANTLLFLAGANLIAAGLMDDSLSNHRLAGAGWVMIVLSLFLGIGVSEWKPSVCTCPSHRDIDGCR